MLIAAVVLLGALYLKITIQDFLQDQWIALGDRLVVLERKINTMSATDKEKFLTQLQQAQDARINAYETNSSTIIFDQLEEAIRLTNKLAQDVIGAMPQK